MEHGMDLERKIEYIIKEEKVELQGRKTTEAHLDRALRWKCDASEIQGWNLTEERYNSHELIKN